MYEFSIVKLKKEFNMFENMIINNVSNIIIESAKSKVQ